MNKLLILAQGNEEPLLKESLKLMLGELHGLRSNVSRRKFALYDRADGIYQIFFSNVVKQQEYSQKNQKQSKGVSGPV